MTTFQRIAAAIVLTCAAAGAQRLTWYERLLLVEAPRTISGVVVDDSGQPVSGAHIDHSDIEPREQLFTDDRGRFQIRTRAPAVVIRKLGYNGQLVRISGLELRVVLHRATRAIPKCSQSCLGLETAASRFCFPQIPGIHTGGQGHYEDTFVRAFTMQSSDRTTELLHGAGPTWTLGIPYTGDVWESKQYSETESTTQDLDIIDARGVAPDGRHWRYLGRYGESASYYEADAQTAAILDRVLDGVCLTAH